MTPTINDTNRWIERCALHSYQRPVPQAVDRYLLPITDRVKGAALSVLRRSVFENYLATDLRKNRLNPLASLIFLLSFIKYFLI